MAPGENEGGFEGGTDPRSARDKAIFADCLFAHCPQRCPIA
jgi:hypothetical protein